MCSIGQCGVTLDMSNVAPTCIVLAVLVLGVLKISTNSDCNNTNANADTSRVIGKSRAPAATSSSEAEASLGIVTDTGGDDDAVSPANAYSVGAYVIVQYSVGRALKHFIAVVTGTENRMNKSEIEVSFLSKTTASKQFRFPDAVHISVIDKSQIVTVMSDPQPLRRGLLQFNDIDLVVHRYKLYLA